MRLADPRRSNEKSIWRAVQAVLTPKPTHVHGEKDRELSFGGILANDLRVKTLFDGVSGERRHLSRCGRFGNCCRTWCEVRWLDRAGGGLAWEEVFGWVEVAGACSFKKGEE